MKMMKKGWLPLIAALGLMVSASQAQALPLLPGGTAVPGPMSLAGEPVLATISGTFSGGGSLKGNYVVEVLRNGAFLDFAYQFQVTKGDVRRTTMFDFSTVTTDVNFTSTAPGSFHVPGGTLRAPSSADRSSDGSAVGFDFGVQGVASTYVLPADGWTQIFFIRTNSRNFTDGDFSLIDGGAATVASFAPTAVPEPSSLILLSMGLAGVGGAAFRRWKAKTVSC